MMAVRPPLYYQWLIRLAKPIYRGVVWHKSASRPTYQREINERFYGKYGTIQPTKKGVIWCHAVSLGELNTAYPLLKSLLNQGFGLWITSTTQTGFERASVLFADELGTVVNHSFVPVDDLAVVERLIDHIHPVAVLFIETELWANTLFALKQHHIPAIMVNARLTDKSYQGYQKFAQVSRSMMANIHLIIAQDENSYHNFTKLGAKHQQLHLAYSLKWVSCPSLSGVNQQLLNDITNHWHIQDRLIWTVGSSHAGEEVLVLETYHQLLQRFPQLLCILVPRHPERFEEVTALCRQLGLVTHRRSLGETICQETQVYLADSMGELLVWYAVSNVVLVGGSLIDGIGGHNPIEPASFAKPIIMGQFTKNCTEIVADMTAQGALVVVDSDVNTLSRAVDDWLSNPSLAMQAGEQGLALVEQRQGALEKQLGLILECLV